MGRFFLSPRAKRRKKRTTGRQRGTTEGEGEGPRGGRGKCQTVLSFGAQPCCPEGPSRSEAEWSLSTVGVEKRRAAKRPRAVAFALQNQATETGGKTGWSDMATKTDRNQHITGTHGKSQARRAWHWRVTDSQSAPQSTLGCQSSPDTFENDLGSRGAREQRTICHS